MSTTELDSDSNTNTFSKRALKINKIAELYDKVECLQRAQAHIQKHIAESQAETQTEIRGLRDEVKTLLRYFSQR